MVTLLLAAWATPFLHRPFDGDFRASGFFDHGDPARDNDHRQLTQWGEWTWGRRGHAAYDWAMPVGTPVRAAADGVVRLAGDAGPTRCGGNTVDRHVRIAIDHKVDGTPYVTWYLHLSEAEVRPGSPVRAGQIIGRSGNTGCSSGPHLHFAVQEQSPGRPLHIDPFGWAGKGPDPVGGHRTSRWLWLDGEAPLLYRDVPARGRPDGPVGIAWARAVAWKDDAEPNQEWIVIRTVPDSPRRSLKGWSIRNRSGAVVPLPRRARVEPDQPYRLYSGTGRSTPTFGFAGLDHELWDDAGDCALLVDPEGRVVHALALGRREDRLCRGVTPPAEPR